MKLYEKGAIFDEVQHVPKLFSYLQQVVDESSVKGRFVLTGSQNFLLNQHITQSLSGRIGMTTLLPLDLSELENIQDYNRYIFEGSYPALHELKIDPLDFYPSYIQTYIERDVRQLKNIENFGRFRTFLKLCAGRIGQLVNLSSLAQDCGISHTTAKSWLNILEASYIIFFLQPFHQNIGKRFIKMPKIYFYDTGVACSLLGLENEKQLESHYLKGALFENFVILEIVKHRLNQGLLPNLYFWRDRSGREIDIIGEWGGKIWAFQIKVSVTFQTASIKHLLYFKDEVKRLNYQANNYLIYKGSAKGDFKSVNLLPVSHLQEFLKATQVK